MASNRSIRCGVGSEVGSVDQHITGACPCRLSPDSIPEVDVLQWQAEIEVSDGCDDFLEVVAFLA